MPPLTLLLDPRGAIGRRAFWAGLGLLTAALGAVLLILLGLAAWWPVGDLAMAVTPVIGTSLLVAKIIEAVIDRGPPLEQIPIVLLLCARLYPLACLCLKRLRDAGRGPTSLIVVSALSLAFHVWMGQWTYDLWASEIGQIIPLFLDILVDTSLWVIFLIWIGARPSRRQKDDR